MKEQSKDPQFLFKQELLSNIKEKITPNTIKKKNTNNRKLDDTILNQIRNFRNRKKNHESNLSLENQEYVNKDQYAIGRVINEQEGLKRVIDEQEGLKRVVDEQEKFKRVIEYRENKENLLKCVNEQRGCVMVLNEERQREYVNENQQVIEYREQARLLNESQEHITKKGQKINKGKFTYSTGIIKLIILIMLLFIFKRK